MVKTWIKPVMFLLTILLGAFLLRISNLTVLPVFADEAIYIRWSQIMANEPTLRFLPLSDGKQPLYMWVLMFLVSRFEDPLFIGRLVSVFAGLGTIVGIFAASYLLFKNKSVSLIAAFIWCISPFSFFFDRMALVDSMLACFSIWTFFFALLGAKTKRWDVAMLTGFSLGGALLTKSPALFLVLLIPTTWILADFPKNQKKRVLHLVKLLAMFGITLAIGYGMYNILRLGPNFHLISSRNLDYVWPYTRIFESPFDPLRPHFDRSMQYLWAWGPAVIFGLVTIGLMANLRKYRRIILVLLAWSLGPVIIQSEFAKVLTARYIFFTLPFLYILAAISFNTIKLKKLVYLLFVAFVIHALFIDYQLITTPQSAPMPRSERSGYLEEWTAGTGIKESADFIKSEQQKNPNSKFVIGTEGYFGTLPDGLQIYLEGVPNVVVIGVGLHIGEVPQSLRESVEAGNRTYMVANSSRLVFKKPFEEYGLKVVKEFKKADRPNFVPEYTQYGPNDTFYLFEVTSQ